MSKLFKKRKNKDFKTNQTKKPINNITLKPIINKVDSNENASENIQSSSESGKKFFYTCIK